MDKPQLLPEPEGRSAGERSPLLTVALCLVSAAAGWFLLKEFAGLLRPLMLAVMLCYVILPAHLRLRRSMPGIVALVILATASVAAIYLLALLIYSSAVELSDDLPVWVQQAQDFLRWLRRTVGVHLPWLIGEHEPVLAMAPGDLGARTAINALARAAADTLTESVVVGFYLLFLLLEVKRFPGRVRSGFDGPRANQILAIAGNISEAMASYLRVKVKASLALALPVTLVLWVLGVKFPLLWGVLTFVANFIPYMGSIVMCSLPVVLAFLQMKWGWRPIAVGVLLLSIHTASAYLFEPAMTGRAVGLSPLVILLSLAFWGLCWGLVGMVLAVPLTVMLKIILENVPGARPFARLMGEE